MNLDEYKGLPRENDQSYYYFMHENLFDMVNIDPASTNLPDGTKEDSEAECARYEARDPVSGRRGSARFSALAITDIIGFNEPADVFEKDTHCVDLQERTIEANKRFFASADDVPRQAYTMGIGTIMRAKKILVVVSGEDKAETVAKAFFGPVTPQVPASILQMHPDVNSSGRRGRAVQISCIGSTDPLQKCPSAMALIDEAYSEGVIPVVFLNCREK